MGIGLSYVRQSRVRHFLQRGIRLRAFLLRLGLLNSSQGALMLLIDFGHFEQGKHVAFFDAVSFVNFDPLNVSRDLGVKRRLVESLDRGTEPTRKARRFLYTLYYGHEGPLLYSRRS